MSQFFSEIERVIQGDCLEVLKTFPDNHFDALITDPPASISFMGKKWDGDRGGNIQWINWLSEILHEAYRVMKPGAVGAVWSLPRVCGYTQLAIEMAGFRIFDQIAIISGQGFPKSQDISKLIDRELGREGDREVVGRQVYGDGHIQNSSKTIGFGGCDPSVDNRAITAPATPEASHWNGWKTAQLKPSHEVWFLVQRPISEKNIARNVLKWGVGGVNIDAARIGTGEDRSSGGLNTGSNVTNFAHKAQHPRPTGGRFPANCILQHSPECSADGCVEHCPVEILGRQSGVSVSKRSMRGVGLTGSPAFGSGRLDYDTERGHSDQGTAARYFLQLPHDPDTFFYSPKASRSDRTVNGAVENTHPTVKSVHLLEYFCKLLCPPGGIVLDPFGGSGSTALGAIKAGMGYCLIEQEEEYVAIARARIEAYLEQQKPVEPEVEQTSLFEDIA